MTTIDHDLGEREALARTAEPLPVAVLLERLASIDLTPEGANSRRRRNARRIFQRLAEQLPPGVVEHAADADLLTVEQYETAVRWRQQRGLAP